MNDPVPYRGGMGELVVDLQLRRMRQINNNSAWATCKYGPRLWICGFTFKPWICAGCGEEVPKGREVRCWRIGSPKDGAEAMLRLHDECFLQAPMTTLGPNRYALEGTETGRMAGIPGGSVEVDRDPGFLTTGQDYKRQLSEPGPTVIMTGTPVTDLDVHPGYQHRPRDLFLSATDFQQRFGRKPMPDPLDDVIQDLQNAETRLTGDDSPMATHLRGVIFSVKALVGDIQRAIAVGELVPKSTNKEG